MRSRARLHGDSVYGRRLLRRPSAVQRRGNLRPREREMRARHAGGVRRWHRLHARRVRRVHWCLQHRSDHGLCPSDEVCDPAGGARWLAAVQPGDLRGRPLLLQRRVVLRSDRRHLPPHAGARATTASRAPWTLCDETADRCSFTPADSRCDDGRLCNGAETCIVGVGCAPGTPPTCDDGDPCTVDGCETPPGSPGTCAHGPLDRDGDGFGPIGCGGDCDDGNPARYPEALETCNAVDDNCDDRTDEAFSCIRGDSHDCTMPGCGTPGLVTCGATCTWGACTGYAETCNGRDDDCDGDTDEGFGCVSDATRPCAIGTCPGAGTERCGPTCTWSGVCTPRDGYVEVCDGFDNDCDGLTDEDFGCVQYSSGTCTTSCGSTGGRTCTASCTWGACVPPREECNGRDDDCINGCDDGYACCAGSPGGCLTTCGSTGTRACDAACTWNACVPPAETCNAVTTITITQRRRPCRQEAVGRDGDHCGSTAHAPSAACAWRVRARRDAQRRDDDATRCAMTATVL